MAPDNVRDIGGLSKEDIEIRDANIRKDVEFNTKRIDRMENFLYGNGKPALKDDVLGEVDKRILHKDANRQQAEVALGYRVDFEAKDREKEDVKIYARIESVEKAIEKRFDTILAELKEMRVDNDRRDAKINRWAGGLSVGGFVVAIVLHFLPGIK